MSGHLWTMPAPFLGTLINHLIIANLKPKFRTSEIWEYVLIYRYTFCFNFLIVRSSLKLSIINYSKQCVRCPCRPSWLELVMKTSRVVYISLVIETSRNIISLVYLFLQFPPLKGIRYEHYVAFVRQKSEPSLPHPAYHKVGLG